MKRVVRFLRLPFADQWLLVKTAALLGTIRLGLYLLPFQTVLRGVEKLAGAKCDPEATDRDWIHRVAWSVTVVSRYVPGATCLTQALTTQVVLGRRGHRPRLHIGVARGGEEQLQAHAWVEACGETVIGGSEELPRYAKLSPIHGKSSSLSS